MATVIALDLEGTLIKDQIDPQPRPGLYEFLEVLPRITARIVMMTTVPESKFREIAQSLVAQGVAPPWFVQVEYVTWQRPYKDMLQIPGITDPSEALLVDDYEGYVHPDQRHCWLQVETFFDQKNDQELRRMMRRLIWSGKK